MTADRGSFRRLAVSVRFTRIDPV